jgi:hypothetical protein
MLIFEKKEEFFFLFVGFILFLIDVAPIYARQQEIQYSGLV